jgi:hypothetical protein
MPFRRKSMMESSSTKAIIIIILLSMALMRMVWMQFRDYPISSTLRSAATIKLSINQSNDCAIPNKQRFEPLKVASPENSLTTAWLISPGYSVFVSQACQDGFFILDKLIEWNQIFTVLASVLMVFLIRFLTSSWLFAVIIGLGLLSRGELLIKHGQLTYDGLVMFVVSSWFAAAAHFFKTAASFSLLCMICFLLVGIFIDKSLLALGAGFPLFIFASLIMRRRITGIFHKQGNVQKSNKMTGPLGTFSSAITNLESMLSKRLVLVSGRIKELTNIDPSRVFSRGSAFKTLDGPFTLWSYQKLRWLKLVFGWVCVLFIMIFIILYIDKQLYELALIDNYFAVQMSIIQEFQSFGLYDITQWVDNQVYFTDIYFFVSLISVLISILIKPHPKLIHIPEFMLFFVLSLTSITILSFFVDMWYSNVLVQMSTVANIDFSSFPAVSSQVFYWVEPVLLSLGGVGVLYIIKTFFLYGVD